MEGTRTLGAKVFQSANVTIIGINIGIGGKVSGLMNTRTPLMGGSI